jgi:hypothetical protein
MPRGTRESIQDRTAIGAASYGDYKPVSNANMQRMPHLGIEERCGPMQFRFPAVERRKHRSLRGR